MSKHPAGRGLTSDWFRNSFIMVVYEKNTFSRALAENFHSALKTILIDNHYKTISEQECIPVGCVPSTAVAISWGGGRSASVHAWIHYPPGVGLETPPLARPLKLPLGCGPGNLQGMLGYTPVETCKACLDTTCKACWDTPPPCGQNDEHL